MDSWKDLNVKSSKGESMQIPGRPEFEQKYFFYTFLQNAFINIC